MRHHQRLIHFGEMLKLPICPTRDRPSSSSKLAPLRILKNIFTVYAIRCTTPSLFPSCSQRPQSLRHGTCEICNSALPTNDGIACSHRRLGVDHPITAATDITVRIKLDDSDIPIFQNRLGCSFSEKVWSKEFQDQNSEKRNKNNYAFEFQYLTKTDKQFLRNCSQCKEGYSTNNRCDQAEA